MSEPAPITPQTYWPDGGRALTPTPTDPYSPVLRSEFEDLAATVAGGGG
jgi:hypothetical protein